MLKDYAQATNTFRRNTSVCISWWGPIELDIVIYLLLVCFVVFALVLFLMSNVACVSGLPIFL